MTMQSKIDSRTKGNVQRVDVWWLTNSSGYASCDVPLWGKLTRAMTATVYATSGDRVAPSWFSALSAAGSQDIQLREIDGTGIDLLQGILADVVRGSTEEWYIYPDATSSANPGVTLGGRYQLFVSDGFAISQGVVDATAARGVIRFYLER